MALTWGTKRKRSSTFPKWGAKRRRTVRSRRSRFPRRSRNQTWTIQTAKGLGQQYRTRRMKPRTWRAILWRDTMAKQHFRSIGNGGVNITTDTTAGQGLVQALYPTFVGNPGPTTAFWTTTGGLVTPDTGASAITFGAGDMVIRGGRVGLTITVPDAVTDEICINIWVVKLTKRPDSGLLPTTWIYGSNLDYAPEFNQQYGKILYSKRAIVNNSYPAFTLEHRLKVQKIDQEIWGTDLGDQIIFLVSAANMQDTTQNTLIAQVYHDMSFVADQTAATL